jgi:hypothetical protein
MYSQHSQVLVRTSSSVFRLLGILDVQSRSYNTYFLQIASGM